MPTRPPKQNRLDKLCEEEDRKEAEWIRKWKAGEDMGKCPIWIVPNKLLSCWGTHKFCKQHDIKIVESWTSPEPLKFDGEYIATCTIEYKNMRTHGVSQDADGYIAKMFAYRHAVRSLRKRFRRENINVGSVSKKFTNGTQAHNKRSV